MPPGMNICVKTTFKRTKLIRMPSSAGPMHARSPIVSPRYEAMARWGVTITADEVAATLDTDAFETLIAAALARRT